jgi:putative flippase GtrA
MAKVLAYTNRRKSIIQLFRYGLIGIASNLAGYMVYLLITDFGGIPPKVTMSMLYATGAIVGFWGNRKLTFAHKGSVLGSGIRYIITHFFGYLMNFAILTVMVDKLGYPHQAVQAVAIFVVAAFLFLAFKFFVFSKSDISNMENK